jgi:hypothetical protein
MRGIFNAEIGEQILKLPTPKRGCETCFNTEIRAQILKHFTLKRGFSTLK